MNISVAIPTYNGLPYLEKQLSSVLSQTRPPDEVIICDDGSTDGTWEYLSEQARRHSAVQAYSNDEQLGVGGNYQRSIELSSGDLIFLCDQDDSWVRNKIEVMLSAYRETDARLLWHNTEIVDPNGSTGGTLWQRKDFSPNSDTDSIDVFRRLVSDENIVQGASVLADAEFLDRMLPLPARRYDYFLGVTASLFCGIKPVNKILSTYRQHEAQDLGAPRRTRISQGFASLRRDTEGMQRDTMELWERVSRELSDRDGSQLRVAEETAASEVAKRLSYERTRHRALSGSPKIAVRSIVSNVVDGNYRRYNYPVLGPLRDLVSVLR